MRSKRQVQNADSQSENRTTCALHPTSNVKMLNALFEEIFATTFRQQAERSMNRNKTDLSRSTEIEILTWIPSFGRCYVHLHRVIRVHEITCRKNVVLSYVLTYSICPSIFQFLFCVLIKSHWKHIQLKYLIENLWGFNCKIGTNITCTDVVTQKLPLRTGKMAVNGPLLKRVKALYAGRDCWWESKMFTWPRIGFDIVSNSSVSHFVARWRCSTKWSELFQFVSWEV